MSVSEIRAEDKDFLQKVKDILTNSSYVKNGMRASNGPAHIMDHVYLGNKQDANNIRLLKRLKISHVLNCAASPESRYDGSKNPYAEEGIKYLGIEAFDTVQYPILMHFHQALGFIDTCLKEGGRVLVHCEMGVNRSGAIYVAYMMVHENISLLQAIRQVKFERPVLLCNEGFQMQLIDFARQRELLYHKPKAL
jgi:protein-tyrosine phosphatase